MSRKQILAALLAMLMAAAVSPNLAGTLAKHGNDHKPALHRADCSQVATATDNLGFAIFEFDEDMDLQIEIALKHGMPNTEYRAFVLTAPCNVVFIDNILSTNKKGKGNVHIMVPESMIPAGSQVAVQLVSPPGATVPGPGPFTDVITSDFVVPPKSDD